MDQSAYSNAVFYIVGLDKRYKVNRRVGWVYAAYNPLIGGSIFKIGMSSRPPPERARELAQSTGYEGPFDLIYFVHVLDRVEGEKWVHRTLDQYRVRSWEEFFDLPLTLVCDTLDEAARRFPIPMGLPGRHSQKPKGTPQLLPQVFRRWKLVCPGCSQTNDVRELALPVRVKCSACGRQLLPAR